MNSALLKKLPLVLGALESFHLDTVTAAASSATSASLAPSLRGDWRRRNLSKNPGRVWDARSMHEGFLWPATGLNGKLSGQLSGFMHHVDQDNLLTFLMLSTGQRQDMR